MKEKVILNLLKEKEGIDTLNPMQEDVLRRSSEKRDLILLSPTGSGKTVAFLLPLMKMMKEPGGRVQAVIIAPSRELVLQIVGVLKNISVDYRVLSLYGGHRVEDEVNSLKVVPDIIVATPGRLLDHIRRKNIDVLPTRILILDEFDKSLELGFEDEMSKIIEKMKNVSRVILTSATDASVLPEFLNLDNPIKLNYLSENRKLKGRMRVRTVFSEGKDKLDSLLELLKDIAGGETPLRSIVFVNHRDSAARVYEYLSQKGVDVALYHGALDQRDRESALAMFNSGVKSILIATDLAARGLDIRDVRNVIHYHQPLSAEAYTHRNGRTARIDDSGDIYLLLGPDEEMKEYVESDGDYRIDKANIGNLRTGKEMLYISSGKKEKLSKGDILGFLTKEVGISGNDIGKIEVFDHYSLVTVDKDDVPTILEATRTKKIKGERRKVELIRGSGRNC